MQSSDLRIAQHRLLLSFSRLHSSAIPPGVQSEERHVCVSEVVIICARDTRGGVSLGVVDVVGSGGICEGEDSVIGLAFEVVLWRSHEKRVS